MTDLRCEVSNCVYNEKCLCSRHEINVGNPMACTEKETCCESFSESRDAAKNACVSKNPDSKIVIRCEALKCVYNDNHYCSADSVNIGDTSANTTKETKCETFKAR